MLNEDVHVVEFRETGYGLQHPLACRPNLLDCEYNVYLQELDEPDKEPGRYIMMMHDVFEDYTAVTYTNL